MNDAAAVNPDGTIETERDTINRLVKNRDELVQHLQSQKEEIEELTSQLEWQAEKTSQNLCIAEAFEKDNESLKAITELAVKELQFYADEEYYDLEQEEHYIKVTLDRGDKARTALSEIRRLSHE